MHLDSLPCNTCCSPYKTIRKDSLSGDVPELPRRHCGHDGSPCADEQAHGDGVGPVGGVVLARVGVGGQLGALAGLEHGEDDGGDEGADELRDGLVDVEDAKVDARQLARRGRPAAATAAAAAADAAGRVQPVLHVDDGVGRARARAVAAELDAAPGLGRVREASVGDLAVPAAAA